MESLTTFELIEENRRLIIENEKLNQKLIEIKEKKVLHQNNETYEMKKEYEKRIRDLKAKNVGLQTQYQNLVQKYNKLIDISQNLMSQVEELENKAVDMTKYIERSSYESILTNRLNEIDTLKNENKDLQKRIIDLEQKNYDITINHIIGIDNNSMIKLIKDKCDVEILKIHQINEALVRKCNRRISMQAHRYERLLEELNKQKENALEQWSQAALYKSLLLYYNINADCTAAINDAQFKRLYDYPESLKSYFVLVNYKKMIECKFKRIGCNYSNTAQNILEKMDLQLKNYDSIDDMIQSGISSSKTNSFESMISDEGLFIDVPDEYLTYSLYRACDILNLPFTLNKQRYLHLIYESRKNYLSFFMKRHENDSDEYIDTYGDDWLQYQEYEDSVVDDIENESYDETMNDDRLS